MSSREYDLGDKLVTSSLALAVTNGYLTIEVVASEFDLSWEDAARLIDFLMNHGWLSGEGSDGRYLYLQPESSQLKKSNNSQENYAEIKLHSSKPIYIAMIIISLLAVWLAWGEIAIIVVLIVTLIAIMAFYDNLKIKNDFDINISAYERNKKRTSIAIGCIACLFMVDAGLLLWANSQSPLWGEAHRQRIRDEKIIKTARNEQAEGEIKEIKINRLARNYVKANLKDPDSAKFQNQTGLCGEVNSKNSFGAYTGFIRFMAPNANAVIFDDESVFSHEDFNQAWKQSCK